ncbi:MAG: hypothetical protein P8X73_07500 [Ignavibacteriaceae bacterium]
MHYGRASVFVAALADAWTIAMSKMLLANNMLESNYPIITIAEKDALETLKRITHRSEILTHAIFQEPFGFAAVGVIHEAFEKTFEGGSFAVWLEALENKDYGKCISITG